MNNRMYIIPANSKKGKLIFNIFRPVDLAVFLSGLAISIIFFFAIPGDSLIATVIKLLPLLTTTFLVVPVAFYHNVMCFIKELIDFLQNRRIYYWKGGCVRDEYKDEQ